MIRYGELELPQGAIAQLVLALKEAGESSLAYTLGRAIDANASELRLTPNDYAPILHALAGTPIPELADFSRALEGRSRRPTSDELATLREKRMAANEAFFRELNEKLEELEPNAADSDTLIVVCECADEDCAKRLELTHREYKAIRSNPTQFIVAHEHADLEIEEVISRTERFEVVRKLGEGADVAARLYSSENDTDPVSLDREGL